VEKLFRENRLRQIPGIGEGIARKIERYLDTGRLPYYEELKREIPEGLLAMVEIPGLGPKKAKLIYEKLGIKSVHELREACQKHKLAGIPTLGTKTEENILRGISLRASSSGRMLLSTALLLSSSVIQGLKGRGNKIKKMDTAGSLRRGKETIGDIDILCISSDSSKVMDLFIRLPQVKTVLASGRTRASVILEQGIQADLRILSPESYGAALMYFTGSKEHNIALRELAIRRGLKINEYGLFKGSRRIAGKSEEEVFKKLGLQYIPPELREHRGEIEQAIKGKLPALVEEKDLKGDLHIHSSYSDGSAGIEKIVQRAKEKGWEWVAVCDHSQRLKIARGLNERELKKKLEEIKRINRREKRFRVFCGTEVDILDDGTLDYPDKLLRELDFVIAAIHSGFRQSQERLTTRILRAMENPYVDMIAHPSGRLLGKREPYPLDMDEIFKQAHKTNTALEINAYPERLDLTDHLCYEAKKRGVMLGIGTDAHHLEQLDYLALGTLVARRGWLERGNLLNTLSQDKLIERIRKSRKGERR